MKNNNLILLTLILFVSTLCFTACNKDDDDPNPCENVSCDNGGTCDNGDCNCLEGFTGTNCETAVEAGVCDDIDATFNGDVKDVLSVTCSYDVCHGPSSNFGQLDYNIFSNLQTFLENGSFEARVLNGGNADNPIMPPPYTPDGNPKELTAEQLQILTCWKEAGYPEN